MSVRAATHAGSWYSDDAAELDRELAGYLARVPALVRGIGAAPGAPEPVPVAGARAIIAPCHPQIHAVTGAG
jgi:predicted class III extradiol MEMO1 family dioxygenase